MPPNLQVLFHDVQNHGELREHEDSIAGVLQPGQNIVEKVELSTLAEFVVGKSVVFDTLKIFFVNHDLGYSVRVR